MTKADELLALADRVEGEKPGRKLDAAIRELMREHLGIWPSGAPKRYTERLGVAMTLTDWCIAHLSEISADGLPMCVLTDGVLEAKGMCLNYPTTGESALARALCAAALRARAALTDGASVDQAKVRTPIITPSDLGGGA